MTATRRSSSRYDHHPLSVDPSACCPRFDRAEFQRDRSRSLVAPPILLCPTGAIQSPRLPRTATGAELARGSVRFRILFVSRRGARNALGRRSLVMRCRCRCRCSRRCTMVPRNAARKASRPTDVWGCTSNWPFHRMGHTRLLCRLSIRQESRVAWAIHIRLAMRGPECVSAVCPTSAAQTRQGSCRTGRQKSVNSWKKIPCWQI